MRVGNPGDKYQLQMWFQDFARLQLGPDGSASWFVISDAFSWRIEFNFKKIPVTEGLWNTDTDNQGGVQQNRVVTESDANINQDLNGDGDLKDQVGYWDQDPGKGSFTRADNAGLPNP